ncbi:MAG: putative nucleic acid-binding protein [Candidatus Latescibacterota bacterium]|jgi:predicted nucleic acid-binding protein
MPDETVLYYCDTVTLCNFAFAKRLDLLTTRYGTRLQITPTVQDEIADGIAAGYTILHEIEKTITTGMFGASGVLNNPERDIFRDLLRTLSPGEASCIACAQTRGGIVITDDKAARAACQDHTVKFTGTIGILKACCRDEILSPREADTVLQAMGDAGYFSPVSNISGLL